MSHFLETLKNQMLRHATNPEYFGDIRFSYMTCEALQYHTINSFRNPWLQQPLAVRPPAEEAAVRPAHPAVEAAVRPAEDPAVRPAEEAAVRPPAEEAAVRHPAEEVAVRHPAEEVALRHPAEELALRHPALPPRQLRSPVRRTGNCKTDP